MSRSLPTWPKPMARTLLGYRTPEDIPGYIPPPPPAPPNATPKDALEHKINPDGVYYVLPHVRVGWSETVSQWVLQGFISYPAGDHPKRWHTLRYDIYGKRAVMGCLNFQFPRLRLTSWDGDAVEDFPESTERWFVDFCRDDGSKGSGDALIEIDAKRRISLDERSCRFVLQELRRIELKPGVPDQEKPWQSTPPVRDNQWRDIASFQTSNALWRWLELTDTAKRGWEHNARPDWEKAVLALPETALDLVKARWEARRG